MIGAFSYKGKSSLDFGLICQSVKRPLLPEIKTNYVSLVGSSGVYDIGGDVYNTRNLTMRIQYLGASSGIWPSEYYSLREKARDIAAWLGGGTWEKLIITGEEDKYYLAKIQNEIDLQTAFAFGTADIEFVCQPFAYGEEMSVSVGDLVPSMNIRITNVYYYLKNEYLTPY